MNKKKDSGQSDIDGPGGNLWRKYLFRRDKIGYGGEGEKGKKRKARASMREGVRMHALFTIAGYN